jgi:hypothetical protein
MQQWLDTNGAEPLAVLVGRVTERLRDALSEL